MTSLPKTPLPKTFCDELKSVIIPEIPVIKSYFLICFMFSLFTSDNLSDIFLMY